MSFTINVPGISINCEIRPVPPLPPPNDEPSEDFTDLFTLYAICLSSKNSASFVGVVLGIKLKFIGITVPFLYCLSGLGNPKPVGKILPGSLLVNGLICVDVTPTGLLKTPVPFQGIYGMFCNVLLLL